MTNDSLKTECIVMIAKMSLVTENDCHGKLLPVIPRTLVVYIYGPKLRVPIITFILINTYNDQLSLPTVYSSGYTHICNTFVII